MRDNISKFHQLFQECKEKKRWLLVQSGDDDSHFFYGWEIFLLLSSYQKGNSLSISADLVLKGGLSHLTRGQDAITLQLGEGIFPKLLQFGSLLFSPKARPAPFDTNCVLFTLKLLGGGLKCPKPLWMDSVMQWEIFEEEGDHNCRINPVQFRVWESYPKLWESLWEIEKKSHLLEDHFLKRMSFIKQGEM